MPALHIMVIEDDAHTRQFMQKMLSVYGYQVTPWHTAAGAVEQIEHLLPDLVVLDHRLDLPPNGYELLQELHTRPKTAHIPVLLYSAESDVLRSCVNNVRTMGGDILAKPFMPDELLVKLEALMTTVSK